MAEYILYKDSVYNIYETIVDTPIFDRGISYNELVEYIKEEYGKIGLKSLEKRLERAYKDGCSAFDCSLEDCIEMNKRHGLKKTKDLSNNI